MKNSDIDGIAEVLIRNYGVDNVEIQIEPYDKILNQSEINTAIDLGLTAPEVRKETIHAVYFIIKFPQVTLKDEGDYSRELYDLYVIWPWFNGIPTIGFYGFRSTYTIEDIGDYYAHSHLPSICIKSPEEEAKERYTDSTNPKYNFFLNFSKNNVFLRVRRFCIGDSDSNISTMLSTVRDAFSGGSKYKFVYIEALCNALNLLATQESTSSVPYLRIDSLEDSRNSRGEERYFSDSTELTRVFKNKFREYLDMLDLHKFIKLRTSSRGIEWGLTEQEEDTFIKTYLIEPVLTLQEGHPCLEEEVSLLSTLPSEHRPSVLIMLAKAKKRLLQFTVSQSFNSNNAIIMDYNEFMNFVDRKVNQRNTNSNNYTRDELDRTTLYNGKTIKFKYNQASDENSIRYFPLSFNSFKGQPFTLNIKQFNNEEAPDNTFSLDTFTFKTRFKDEFKEEYTSTLRNLIYTYHAFAETRKWKVEQRQRLGK